MSLITLIMLRARTLENGRFSPTLAYSFVLLLQKPRIRVIEYESDRFKAVACLTVVDNKLTPEGLFLETLSSSEQCGIYVFVHEAGVWKLTAFFLTTPPVEHVIRDWEQAPEWLKDIIGEFPRDPSMLDERYRN